jgi:hypothetical protein
MVKKAVGGKHKKICVYFKTNGGVASAIIKLKTPLTQLLRITITPMRIYMILVFLQEEAEILISG